MQSTPTVLIRLKKALDQASTPLLNTMGTYTQKPHEVVTVGLIYAVAWWWDSGAEGALPDDCVPDDLLIAASRSPGVSAWLEGLATEGAPVLANALGLHDVITPSLAAQNSVAHLLDLSRTLPDTSCDAVAKGVLTAFEAQISWLWRAAS